MKVINKVILMGLILTGMAQQINAVTPGDCTPTELQAKDPCYCYKEYKKHHEMDCLMACLHAKHNFCSRMQ